MKKALVLVLTLSLLLALSAPAFAGAETTVLSNQNLNVNGNSVNCEKYNIDGFNYFKLRDLAYVLNGTDAQFNVTYDEESRTMSVTTGTTYHPTGTELNLSGGDKSATSVLSSQTLLIDGVPNADITVYNIGGNNYFKLQDLDDIFGFGLDYNATTRTMLITTTEQVKKNEITAEEIYAACSPAVFYIEVYDKEGYCTKTGSGFFIDSDGTAVTNYHVISGAASAAITLSDSGRVCEVLGVYDWSEEEDWAVLKIEGSGFPYLTIGSAATVIGGAAVCAIGSPLGLQNTISQGIISNPNRVDTGMSYIQTSAAISAGSSGGALLNKYGEVIGITAASYDDGQNLNLAIPMSYLAARRMDTLTPLETAAAAVISGSIILDTAEVEMTVAEPYFAVDICALTSSDAVYVQYIVDDDSVVTCSWSDWYYDDIYLYLYPQAVGETIVDVFLYTEADELLDSKTIQVTVTEAPKNGPYGSCLMFDEYDVELYEGDTWYIVCRATPGDYVGSYLLSYSIDDPSVVSCEWSEWYDENYIDLDLTALAAGSTNVWIYLKTEDGTVLDYDYFTLTVL